MYEPIDFNEQAMRDYFNLQPSSVKGEANDAVAFNKRYLFTKVMSCFKFKLPKSWAMNYFRFWLFQFGSIGVIYTKELGWICSPYSVTKLDYQYQPAAISVVNKSLNKTKNGIIGLNAGIIKLMDDFYGLNDLVTKYAVQLAQIDRSVNVNLMNCNVTAFFEAESKKQADEIKEAYEQATTGKPLVVVNKRVMGDKDGLSTMFPGASSNYIVDKLLAARRTIVNQFLTEIGIKNANYDKKERLNSMEVEQNEDETSAIISVIFDNVKDCVDNINAMAEQKLIEVELRYNYNDLQEVATNGQNNA